MLLKEAIEDPGLLAKVQGVLRPLEFTKVDGIIDLVFSATQDVREDVANEELEDETTATREAPVDFHDACVTRIQSHLGCQLVKRSRVTFTSTDGSILVMCAVSKEHHSVAEKFYWNAFHPYHEKSLVEAKSGYVAFGCGSSERTLLIPVREFLPWLSSVWTTTKAGRSYWHIKIFQEGSRLVMHRISGETRIDLTKYLL